MRLRLPPRRISEALTFTAAVAALAWVFAHFVQVAGPPLMPWPIPGVLGWPLALAL